MPGPLGPETSKCSQTATVDAIVTDQAALVRDWSERTIYEHFTLLAVLNTYCLF